MVRVAKSLIVLLLVPIMATSCKDRASMVGTLPDGTRFEMTGLSQRDAGRPTSFTSVLGIELKEGRRVLGVHRLRERQPGDLRPQLTGRQIVIPVCQWTLEIEVYDDIARAAATPALTDVPSHVAADCQDGFPVLRLTEPLFFALQPEFPAEIALDFNDFRIRKDCGGQIADALCSADGQVMVLGAERAGITGLTRLPEKG